MQQLALVGFYPQKFPFFFCSELSTEKANSIRIQNEMTLDIEKLIRHNEVLGLGKRYFVKS
jgi:hypothetical protein